VREKLAVLCFITFVLFICTAKAQSPTGTVSGIVLDPSGGAIAGAEVLIINDATAVQYPGEANGEGYYVVPNIPPGIYRIQVSKSGFKTIIKPDIVIHVEDALAINFTLPLGAASEIVTVEGGAPLINTESAAVSTVVDRKYVENMPLNGRSLQDLILLTPGVVTNNPQQASVLGTTGEFSVNGQRTESNYYTVDGVSANTGIYPGDRVGAGNSGSLSATTALGTTQALASIDALQEFRVQTSTYSAEYGRNPGGQFSFVTRSGTNEWHGSAFDYLRNDYFDANNWFNDFYGKPEPPLRQNDFGGTLGGPIEIPRVYRGKDRTFFFFSYEGLRLIQPQAATLDYVPDTALRQSTPVPLQAVMNAYPLPNGPEALDSMGNPTGMAQFISTWSNPSSLDAYSIRLDHNFRDLVRIFFRFSNTPSQGQARTTGAAGSPSSVQTFEFEPRTYTLGATSVFSSRLNNEFRLNYSSNLAELSNRLDNFGGAQPVDFTQLQQINESSTAYEIQQVLSFSGYGAALTQEHVAGHQKQWNATDAASISLGRNQLRFGIDYRRTAPIQKPGILFAYDYFQPGDALANSPGVSAAINEGNAYPLFTNFSAFAQDEWKVTRRFSLAMGLRWEVNPAPGATQGGIPYTAVGSSLATLALAPQGTPLWKTDWYNFAPRLGVAYILRDSPGWEAVVRAGGGLFFDTGQQLGYFGFGGVGFTSFLFSGYLEGAPSSFPIPPAQVPPAVSTPTPPYDTIVMVFPPHYQLPYTLQWNVALEQALGKAQSVSVTYVGSHGARLLEIQRVSIPASVNPRFPDGVYLLPNGLTSDYDALQLQYKRRISSGLTALASYTFGHSIDYGSQDSSQPYIRGNSDFDVRHNFSSALSYDLPNVHTNRIARAALNNWGIDDRFSARSAFPVTLDGGETLDPATDQLYYAGLNLNPGVPVYLSGSDCPGCPGGRRINPAAFSLPVAGETGDAPRNSARGFGAWQMDLAIRREFPVRERLKLQFRAEAFNIFNHPNFGLINPVLQQTTFGEATATLNTSLGTLSPLYQMGGPRSMQFALKLLF
jgi:Carboxypeptidase regulatory-like domain/TonB dependent receptor/TonB-dependent Receptor Plug Domain